MAHPNKKNSGMTLVELAVILAVIGVIGVPVMTVFIRNYTAYYRDTAKIRASSEMRYAANQVLTALRSADQGTVALTGEGRVDFHAVGADGGAIPSYVRFDEPEQALKMKGSGEERILLTRVSQALITVTDGYFSVTLTTETPMPFAEAYRYQRTYDYKLRSE